VTLLHCHVKHAFGISEEYNDHTKEHLWYGAGQGAGNVAPQWVVLANSLILAYVFWSLPWILHFPNQTAFTKQGFDTFMDDTTITNVATPTDALQDTVDATQYNLNIWNDLLQASGGIWTLVNAYGSFSTRSFVPMTLLNYNIHRTL